MYEGKYAKVKFMLINALLFFFFFVIFTNISNYFAFDLFASKSQQSYKQETTDFKHYINKHLNYQSFKDKHYFLIINSDGCDICAIKNIEKISNLKFTKDLTLIISGDLKLDPAIINKSIKNVVYDKNAYFFDLEISPLNNCLIEVENNKITDIIQFGTIIQNQKLKHIVEWH
jgi:hypothetical protein